MANPQPIPPKKPVVSVEIADQQPQPIATQRSAAVVSTPPQPQAIEPSRPPVVVVTQSQNPQPIVPTEPVVVVATPGDAQPITPQRPVVSVTTPGSPQPIVPIIPSPGGGGSCTPPLAPSILPVPGSYQTDLQQVSFESDEQFVGFYYTLDGSDPRVSGVLWNGVPFTMTQQGAVEIKVCAQGYNGLFSEVVTGSYVWTFPNALPATISPNSGTYTAPLPITMSSPQGLEIRYTTDGSTPTQSSPLYTGVFNLPAGTYVVKNRVFGPQFNPSPVTERSYQVNVVSTLALAVFGTGAGKAFLTTDENLVTWTELKPLGNTTAAYRSICASSGTGVFGKYIYIGISGVGLFRSEDFGATFVNAGIGGYDRVCCSKSGQYVYATAGVSGSGSGIMARSSDFGVNWTIFNVGGLGGAVNALSCDGSGQYVYAMRGSNRTLFLSSNFGLSFVGNIGGIPSGNGWNGPAANATGSVFFVGAFNNPPQGTFEKWTNFGATRTRFFIDANPVSTIYGYWGCDDLAQSVIIARGPGRVYLNSSGGNQTGWAEVAPSGAFTDLNWTGVDTNGVRQIACTDQRLYASVNNGASWFEAQPDGNNNRSWLDVKIYSI